MRDGGGQGSVPRCGNFYGKPVLEEDIILERFNSYAHWNFLDGPGRNGLDRHTLPDDRIRHSFSYQHGTMRQVHVGVDPEGIGTIIWRGMFGLSSMIEKGHMLRARCAATVDLRVIVVSPAGAAAGAHRRAQD